MARILKGPDGKPMTDEEIKHALRVYATNHYGGEGKYDFMQIADIIAQVESGNDPLSHQTGGGPGRGKYQYEAASARSASNRLRDIASIVGYDNPSWNTVSNTQDLSTLTETQQDIMFLADKLAAGDVDLRSLSNGTTSNKDFWLNSHWKGNASDRQDRADHWDETVAAMKAAQLAQDSNGEHISEPILEEEAVQDGPILPTFKHKDGGFRLKKKYKVNKYPDGGYHPGDPIKPSTGKPATRSDSLDVYNKSEEQLKRYLDAGYEIISNDEIPKTQSYYTWQRSETPDLPADVWAKLKTLWTNHYDVATDKDSTLDARVASQKIYDAAARSVQKKYNLEDAPEFKTITNRSDPKWVGDEWQSGEILDWDHVPTGKESRSDIPIIRPSPSRHLRKGSPAIENIDENKYLRGDIQNHIVNPDMPWGYHDRRIEPVNIMELRKMIPNSEGKMVPDLVTVNMYNALDKELGLPIDPQQLFVSPEKKAIEALIAAERAKIKAHRARKALALRNMKKPTPTPPIADPVYETGADNGISTMATFSTGLQNKFTGVQTMDQDGNRIRTSVEDLPEYIRNDATFQSLIENANEEYRNNIEEDMNSPTSSKSTRYLPSKSSRILEAIMTGKTTLEEYKKTNIHQQFASGGIIRVNQKGNSVRLKKKFRVVR